MPLFFAPPHGQIFNSNFQLQYTRDRSSQSNESNCVDWILKENKTAQMASDISDDSSTNTDHSNGDHKAGIAITNT